jgi:hypothetical protein
MSARSELTATLDDHQKAFTEVSFLVDIFARTVHDLMGGATASVGRIAGRHFARKLPITLESPTLPQVVDAYAHHVRKGFEISHAPAESGLDLTFDKCAMREVCRSRNMEPGGEVCRLYHMLVDGVVNELYSRPTKSTITSTGDRCTAHLEVRE